MITRGTVYTVEGIITDSGIDMNGAQVTAVCLVLQEAPGVRFGGETNPNWGYAARRFRPLDERRLDIFRAMLVSPPKVPA